MYSNNYLTSPNPSIDMKNTFRIARAELLSLFYSPVAWLVIIFYFIIFGIVFTNPMTESFTLQRVLDEGKVAWNGFDAAGLTSDLTWPLLQQMVNHLYLFTPLLTMGVINREVNAGTIRLLYSSPVRTREIVLGKYLGLLMLTMVLVLMAALFLFTSAAIITHPEIERHFASLLGIFLVANAYIAIGLFISSLTNYQVVAGVLTFVVFFMLNSVSRLWQQYDLIRDITWFLAISGRSNYFIDGLISTRDLLYFILVTILFLGWTMIRLRSGRESRSQWITFGRYAGIFMIVMLLGYLSNRPGNVKYWDLTRSKSNTISADVQGVLKELDGSRLSVTLYTNLFGPNAVNGLPQNRNFYIWKLWEQYRRFYPNMEFNYVYYYDIYEGDSSLLKQYPGKTMPEIASKIAKELGIRKSIFLTPGEIRKKIDLREEGRDLVMQLEYKGKKTWLRTFRDNTVWPDQQVTAGAISRLSRDTVPRMLFTCGHYERNPYKVNERDYGYYVLNPDSRSSMLNLGTDADTISLRTSDIPAGTAALVVADPRSAIQPVEQEKIRDFVQKGGNALFLAEIDKQSMINPVLASLGVRVDGGTIVHPNDQEMPHLLKASLTDAAMHLSGEKMMYEYRRGVLRDPTTVIEGGANISYTNGKTFNIAPLIRLAGDPGIWIENGVLVVDSAAPTLSIAAGDVQRMEYTLGVALTRPAGDRQQRIIVTGDADMLTTTRNGALGNAFYSWLLYNKYPFYANYPGPTDKYFTASQPTITAIRIGYAYIIPALLIVLAITLLVRRKRK